MKERPIIFSHNIDKILDGTKTQTRRVVKPQPIEWQIGQDILGLAWKGGNLGSLSRDHRGSIAENYLATLCPYGQVGDRLWVREGCHIVCWLAETWVDVEYPAGRGFKHFVWTDDIQTYFHKVRNWRGTKSSIHMPRWASRITLEITEVRVERQLDITLEDAIKEGFGEVREFNETFLHLNPYLKEANPWVWVISFNKLS